MIPKIAFFNRTDGGCDYYRGVLPLCYAHKQKLLDVTEIKRWEVPSKKHLIAEADVVLIPRPAGKEFLPIYNGLREMGKKIVLDWDDNPFRVSPLSEHYRDHGTQEVRYRWPNGDIQDLWVDGKNIDLEKNKEDLEFAKGFIREADLVMTTTEILADVFREFNDSVVVAPNCVDVNLWKKLPLLPTPEIRLCWFGGHSHYEDWYLLKDVLPTIMEKYPQVKLVLMGTQFKGVLKDIPQERIEFYNWVPTAAYPYKAAILNPTISLIPLVDNEFNRCKSPIKFIEMAALQVPSVVSYVSPYKEIATEENGIFVDNEPGAWVKGISHLIENESVRIAMGQAARRYVEENFDIEKKAHMWADAYNKLFQLEVVK